MRILYINHDAELLSGADKVLVDLLECLRGRLSAAMVVLPRHGPIIDALRSLETSIEIVPIDYLWCPTPKKYYLELRNFRDRLRRLRIIIDQFKPDIIHCNTIYPVDGYLLGNMLDIPVIGHVHGNFLPDDHPLLTRLGLSTEWLGRFLNQTCNRIVAVSNSVRTSLLPYMSAEKISVIPNGLNLVNFDLKSSQPVFGDLGRPATKDGKLTVLTIGRVCEEKGFDILIEAARLAATAFPDAIQFLIVGPFEDSDLEHRLRTQIKDYGLESTITFLGLRDDVPALLSQADIVLSTSRTEGLPFAVIEGMAARRPVVATRSGGSEQIIKNGENGYLVDIDPHAVSAKLLNLAKDAELRHQIGQQARLTIEDDFSLDKFAENWFELYTDVNSHKHQLDDDQHDLSLEITFNLMSEIADQGITLSDLDHRVRDLENLLNKVKSNVFFRIGRRFKNIIKRLP